MNEAATTIASAGRLPPRRLVVVPATAATTRADLLALLPEIDAADAAWLGGAPPPGFTALAPGRAAGALGQEFGVVVFDARAGFHADAFGAVGGTVRAGGLLVLAAPPLAEWPAFDDPDYARIAVSGYPRCAIRGRFLRRLVAIIRADPHVLVLGPDERCPGLTPRPPSSSAEYRSEDQREAVAALERLGLGRTRRPLVLTADRGRGKSAALGIAAAHLLRDGVERIVVTAPRQAAAARVFEHAARSLPRAHGVAGRVRLAGRELVFVPPDELAHAPAPDPARLVLVDEAAAIPAPLLERLLLRCPRIAFATTVHGYEGTGRGFAVRFHQVLDRHTPRWRKLTLETPIRWAPNDPLERFVHRALALDAAAAPDAALAVAAADDMTVELLDRDALARDEPTLRELFGLLVQAHYRTRPFDLRMLLDGPNIHVFSMRCAGHVAGVLLAAVEGGFDTAAAEAIWAGRRRPHGHMMPESLAAHAGLLAAPRLRGARVVRIAVHPAVQGRGLGTRLLAAAAAALPVRVDYWGASFGATPPLLRFWARGGYRPVRVSVTRGAASGTHSVMEMRPVSEAGTALHEEARVRLAAQLPAQLAEPLRELEPALAGALLAGLPLPPLAFDVADWRDVLAFAFANRLFEAVPGPLARLALHALAADAGAGLAAAERDALIVKVLQKRGWPAAAQTLGVGGRAEAVRCLRGVFAKLLQRTAPPMIRAEARRLAQW